MQTQQNENQKIPYRQLSHVVSVNDIFLPDLFNVVERGIVMQPRTQWIMPLVFAALCSHFAF